MKKYILVTGGELKNKGAQAMVYTTVDKLSQRYPMYRVVLISSLDYNRPIEEQKNYKFDIVKPYDIRLVFNVLKITLLESL